MAVYSNFAASSGPKGRKPHDENANHPDEAVFFLQCAFYAQQ